MPGVILFSFDLDKMSVTRNFVQFLLEVTLNNSASYHQLKTLVGLSILLLLGLVAARSLINNPQQRARFRSCTNVLAAVSDAFQSILYLGLVCARCLSYINYHLTRVWLTVSKKRILAIAEISERSDLVDVATLHTLCESLYPEQETHNMSVALIVRFSVCITNIDR